MSNKSYLGIDFGTSGARAILINNQLNILAQSHYSFTNTNLPLDQAWKKALFNLLDNIPHKNTINRIAINGTSSTVLLCDQTGQVITEPLLYNDTRGIEVIEQLKNIAPTNHLVISATSSLAKLLYLKKNIATTNQLIYFLHQADYLAFLLHGLLGITDYHNALKLGYNVETLSYPNWLNNRIDLGVVLPKVLVPGTAIAPITSEISQKFGLPSNCIICAGTTDSIAAFLAAGVTKIGEAVTSLGSTLVLKLLSQTPVNNLQYGIYSHRLGSLWLVGGASNSGGAVLKQFFSNQELKELSALIDPNQDSIYQYYPLTKTGERFPINNPHLLPQIEPRPDDPVLFLQGLLTSIAKIEATGYQLLHNQGASPLNKVYTAGKGAINQTWTQIRARYLAVEVVCSPQTEAAYGTARLAKDGISHFILN